MEKSEKTEKVKQTELKKLTNSSRQRYILSLETGIGGGSLAILEGQRPVAFWTGNESVSKSEDILAAISEICLRNRIGKNDFELIAVGEGPGSLTGLRIGTAIGLGLQSSLRAPLVRVETLQAMTVLKKKIGTGEGKREIISAVPIGRNNVCWQRFISEGRYAVQISERTTDSIDEFGEILAAGSEFEFILHRKLFEYFSESRSHRKNADLFIDAEKDLARLIGISAQQYASDNNTDTINSQIR